MQKFPSQAGNPRHSSDPGLLQWQCQILNPLRHRRTLAGWFWMTCLVDEKLISRSKTEMEIFNQTKLEGYKYKSMIYKLGRASQKALRTLLPIRSQGAVIQVFWDRGLNIKWRIIDSLHILDLSIMSPNNRSGKNFAFFFFWPPCSIWSSWVAVVTYATAAATPDPLTHCDPGPRILCCRGIADFIAAQRQLLECHLLRSCLGGGSRMLRVEQVFLSMGG